MFNNNRVSEREIELSNGLKFYLPSKRLLKAAEFLIGEIFKRERYARDGFEIAPDDIVIDGGANMGLFSLWVAPQVEGGKVIAIEPIKEAINILDNNIKRNNISNIKTIKAAIGNNGEDVEFLTYPGFNVINHHVNWRPTLYTRVLVNLLTSQWRCAKVLERTPALSIGRIIDDNELDRVDLLKLDIEGCEYEVFRTLEDRHFEKIERIIMEYHEYSPGNKGSELAFIFRSKGYNVEIEKPFLDYYFGKCGFIWAWKS